jgi:hypothetical protein
MQVASNQASRALSALRDSRRRGAVRRRRRARRPAHAVSPLTLDDAFAEIHAQPPVRQAHVAVARGRVERGEHPSADEVAGMAIRRAVCDALG